MSTASYALDHLHAHIDTHRLVDTGPQQVANNGRVDVLTTTRHSRLDAARRWAQSLTTGHVTVTPVADTYRVEVTGRIDDVTVVVATHTHPNETARLRDMAVIGVLELDQLDRFITDEQRWSA